ncbi:MAG: hypothetical protein ACFE85_16035 [Candidatus Hodarchaeota archaeon]
MVEKIKKPLKLTFLIHFFVSIFFGIVFLIMTQFYVDLIGWPYLDPVVGPLLGATFVGFAASSLLAWRETDWIKVKIVVQMEMVWCAVGSIVLITCFFLPYIQPLPLFTWVNIAILLAFFVAFTWFYFQHEHD